MQIYSKETGYPAYVVFPAVDGGFQWKLCWRYNKVSQVFPTIAEALADAQRDYETLREETATVHCGRRGTHKEYHI